MTVALEITLTALIVAAWWAIAGRWNVGYELSRRVSYSDSTMNLLAAMSVSMFLSIAAVLLLVATWTAALWLSATIFASLVVVYVAAYRWAVRKPEPASWR